MRVSSDPTAAEYNPRVRGVTLNDRQIEDWAIADDFRRCVVLSNGHVLNGAVGIQLEPGDEPNFVLAPAPAPIDTGFTGVFVPAATPAPTAAPTPAPTAAPTPAAKAPARKHKHRR